MEVALCHAQRCSLTLGKLWVMEGLGSRRWVMKGCRLCQPANGKWGGKGGGRVMVVVVVVVVVVVTVISKDHVT